MSTFIGHIKRDVERICEKCVTCRQAKSRTQPHGLYTPLPVPTEPWVDIFMDFVLGLPRSKKGRDSVLLLLIAFLRWHTSLHVTKLMMHPILLICSLEKLLGCMAYLEQLCPIVMLNF